MKIRTDFVTNSSSSSFIVSLNIKTKDDKDITMTTEEMHGDVEEFDTSLYVTDKNGDVVNETKFNPMDVLWNINELDEDGAFFEEYDPEELASTIVGSVTCDKVYTMDGGLKYIESCMEMSGEELAKSFFPLYGDENDNDSFGFEDDEEDSFEDDEEEDGLFGRLVKMGMEEYKDASAAYSDILYENIPTKDDIKTMTLRMTFEGRGDMIEGKDEILSTIFGEELGGKISNILNTRNIEKEYDTCKEELSMLPDMDKFTVETIDNILNFEKEFDDFPWYWHVEITRTDSGKAMVDFEQ